MSDPAKQEEQRLEREALALKGAVADAIFAWAGIEEALCSLLNDILAIRDRAYGPAIYYVPTAAEIRIAIVDSAVRHWLVGGRPYDDLIAGAWQKIALQLNSCRKVRNKIAHGEMQRWAVHNKRQVRLTGSIFTTEYNPGQFPGMSTNDVKQAARKFTFYTDAIRRLAYCIQVSQATPLDTGALHEAVARLREHLTKAAAQSAGPTPPGPSAPPEPSSQ